MREGQESSRAGRLEERAQALAVQEVVGGGGGGGGGRGPSGAPSQRAGGVLGAGSRAGEEIGRRNLNAASPAPRRELAYCESSGAQWRERSWGKLAQTGLATRPLLASWIVDRWRLGPGNSRRIRRRTLSWRCAPLF